VDRVLGECGIPGDNAAGRKRFAPRLKILKGFE